MDSLQTQLAEAEAAAENALEAVTVATKELDAVRESLAKPGPQTLVTDLRNLLVALSGVVLPESAHSVLDSLQERLSTEERPATVAAPLEPPLTTRLEQPLAHEVKRRFGRPVETTSVTSETLGNDYDAVDVAAAMDDRAGAERGVKRGASEPSEPAAKGKGKGGNLTDLESPEPERRRIRWETQEEDASDADAEEEWADWNTQDLERRLLLTRDEYSAALGDRKYGEANALNKVMMQIVQELDCRRSGPT